VALDCAGDGPEREPDQPEGAERGEEDDEAVRLVTRLEKADQVDRDEPAGGQLQRQPEAPAGEEQQDDDPEDEGDDENRFQGVRPFPARRPGSGAQSVSRATLNARPAAASPRFSPVGQ
jgi:hypothetical protein